jgi:tryptophan dimethylallyltransferase
MNYSPALHEIFSPTELSWNMQEGGSKPGSDSSLLVRKQEPNMTRSINKRPMSSCLKCSLAIHHWILPGGTSNTILYQFEAFLHARSRMLLEGHIKMVAIAFNLRGSFALLIFYYPFTKPLGTGEPQGELVADLIKHIKINIKNALEVVTSSITDHKRQYGKISRLECVSVDVVKPINTRIKLCVCTPHTNTP